MSFISMQENIWQVVSLLKVIIAVYNALLYVSFSPGVKEVMDIRCFKPRNSIKSV